VTRRLGSRATRRQRWLAGSIALVLLLAGFVSGSHQAAVAHVRCAHGELTHAPVETSASATTTIAHAQQPGSAPSREHGHEHCVLATAMHAVDQAQHVARATITVDARVVATFIVSAVVSRDPVYRTAPKTSPPA
jgi:hypothetical protein